MENKINKITKLIKERLLATSMSLNKSFEIIYKPVNHRSLSLPAVKAFSFYVFI